jgi:hypothetical protein
MARTRGRPGVVIAAAVLLFIFGGISVLAGCCGVVSEAMQETIQGMIPQPPAVQGKKPVNVHRLIAEEVPSKVYVLITFNSFNLILGVVKIIVGIGLLKMSSPARMLAFIVAGLTIFATIVESLYNAIVLMPAMQKAFAEQMKNAPPMPFDFGQLMQGSSWVGTALAILVSMGIWLTVIFLLSGEKVRTAFAEASLPPEIEERSRSRYEGYDDDDQLPPPKSPPDTGITDRPSPPQGPRDTGFTDRPS